jgi:L-lactate dehydrogenase complex protein LldG
VDALHLKHGIADEEVFQWLGNGKPEILPLNKAIVEPAGWREQAFMADFGITSCDAAVAESGTLVLASQPGRSRLTSLAPPVHFCLVPFSRLLPDLVDVTHCLPELKTANEVWITGSSRTADIEGILIRGVHGPGSLIAIGIASE